MNAVKPRTMSKAQREVIERLAATAQPVTIFVTHAPKGTPMSITTDWTTVRTERIVVTPEIAEQLLARNEVNRPFKKRWIAALAEDMRSGRWVDDGMPIRISVNGTLVDGQHRLSAVSLSGTTQTLDFRFGVPMEAQDAMDSGVRRSPGDNLAMKGRENTKTLAAAARLVLKIRAGISPAASGAEEITNGITNMAVLEFANNTELMWEATHYGKMLERVGLNPTGVAAWYYIASELGHDGIVEFCESVRDGGAPVGDPRTALRNWAAGRARNRRDVAGTAYVAMVRAWNAHVQGREMAAMKTWKRGDPTTQMVKPLAAAA